MEHLHGNTLVHESWREYADHSLTHDNFDPEEEDDDGIEE